MIPGSNLLAQAFRAIGMQTFQYYSCVSRTVQTNGQYVTNYSAPVSISGSAQPMPREKFEQYGLDFNKHYYRFYVCQNVLDVGRDVAGDQIVFNSVYYQILSITPWYGIDGWVEILAVEVPAP